MVKSGKKVKEKGERWGRHGQWWMEEKDEKVKRVFGGMGNYKFGSMSCIPAVHGFAAPSHNLS